VHPGTLNSKQRLNRNHIQGREHRHGLLNCHLSGRQQSGALAASARLSVAAVLALLALGN
jgi:hypothetical protein